MFKREKRGPERSESGPERALKLPQGLPEGWTPTAEAGLNRYPQSGFRLEIVKKCMM